MENTQHFDKNSTIPQHVAVIMDGNGRWAKERGLKRTDGHYEGLMALRRVVRAAGRVGVKVITAYAFSTENWQRPISEVNYLMQLPKILNDEILPELIENNVKVSVMGDISRAPKLTQKYITNALDATANNTGLILNIAFNYGARTEIIDAVKAIAQNVADGELAIKQIDEKIVSQHLKTASLGEYADPDFLIRSSGEVRLSNYLLWQLAYAEFYFTDIKWPDFNEEVFLDCLADYQRRQRRFGKISEQLDSPS